MGRTQEERFILKLYDMATAVGDEETVIDYRQVGQELSLSEKKAKAIAQVLAQANFLRRHGKLEVSISSRGLELVNNLRS